MIDSKRAYYCYVENVFQLQTAYLLFESLIRVKSKYHLYVFLSNACYNDLSYKKIDELSEFIVLVPLGVSNSHNICDYCLKWFFDNGFLEVVLLEPSLFVVTNMDFLFDNRFNCVCNYRACDISGNLTQCLFFKFYLSKILLKETISSNQCNIKGSECKLMDYIKDTRIYLKNNDIIALETKGVPNSQLLLVDYEECNPCSLPYVIFLKKMFYCFAKGRWTTLKYNSLYRRMYKRVFVGKTSIKKRIEVIRKKMVVNIYWLLFKYFFKKPKCLSREKTIEKIIEKQLSVVRFGDGEYKLMLGTRNTIGFQDYCDELSSDLKSAFSCNDQRVIVCIYNFLDEKHLNNSFGSWLKLYVYEDYRFIKKIFDYKYIYGDANISRFYHPHTWKTANRDYLLNVYVPKLKKIWENRNLLIVEGKDTKLGYGNDLFDNSISLRRIICPATNAHSLKKQIISTVNRHYKQNDLILLALGPTATVLAYELTILYGYQCIDIGHVDIVYFWLLFAAKTKVGISGKQVNESIGEEVINISGDDAEYLSSIVERLV